MIKMRSGQREQVGGQRLMMNDIRRLSVFIELKD